MKKHLREALRIAADAGLTVVEVRQGKHYLFHCENPHGERRRLTLPSTPSDCSRGLANFKSQARRAAMF